MRRCPGCPGAVLALVVLFLCWPFVLLATDLTPDDMDVIIRLAGKQRMLTQKMGKEILLVVSGVHVAENRYNLEGTAILFDRTLKGLLQGDAGLGLARMDHVDIVAQLETVSRLWIPFQKQVNATLTGKMSRLMLTEMVDENGILLENMNKVVEMVVALAGKNEGGGSRAALFTVINLSGREGMLTQKMTKEFLLIVNGIDPVGNRSKLKGTMDLFDRTLNGLLDGSTELGLPGTREESIRNQLGTVKGLWLYYRPILDASVVGNGGGVAYNDLEKVAQINLRLLGEMHMATKMVEFMAGKRDRSGF